VGDIFEKEISPDLERLHQEMAAYYQMPLEQIEITQ